MCLACKHFRHVTSLNKLITLVSFIFFSSNFVNYLIKKTYITIFFLYIYIPPSLIFTFLGCLYFLMEALTTIYPNNMLANEDNIANEDSMTQTIINNTYHTKEHWTEVLYDN